MSQGNPHAKPPRPRPGTTRGYDKVREMKKRWPHMDETVPLFAWAARHVRYRE